MAIQSLYPAIKPSLNLDFANTKTLDPRITFTRASTATFYDGRTVAKAEENLLLRSQEFDNASWIKLGQTTSANTQLAPDGTTTADTMTATAATDVDVAAYQSNLSGSSAQYVFSVYAKAGTYSFIQLAVLNFQSANANFDLSAGVVGTSDLCTPTITNVGGGWYRCSIAFTATATSTGAAYVFMAASASAARFANWNPVGTETIHLWGAQLEQRSAVTAYQVTTTQPITNYIPVLQTAAAGVARFDHNPVTGESLGLLIEEQRANLLLRSEEFENAAWGVIRLAVSANTLVAPNGALTADTIAATETNANGAFITTVPELSLAASAHTLTVFAKATSSNPGLLVLRPSLGSNFADSVSAWFNLQTGVVSQTLTSGSSSVVTTPVASIESVGNGWFRCRLTFTVTATNTVSNRFYVSDASGLLSVTLGKQAHVWGAQLEAGATPSSYISTVASQVTRNADTQSANGLGQLGQGTFVVDSTTLSGNTLVTSGSTTFAATAATKQRTAVAYDAASTRRSINGAAVTSTAGTAGGANITIAPSANGRINRLALYPRKLSDAELQALSTL
jgi:hypothetical protein